MSQSKCTVDGCDKPSRNKSSAAMCKMHYHRWYRHGHVDMVARRIRTAGDVGKYVSHYMPTHPIAGGSGKVYEHRAVLFDDIGPGWHPCYWCERLVTWDATVGDVDVLQVDHLNNRRDDNRLENLVPSCCDCNAGRGAQRRHDALIEVGFWSQNDTIAHLKEQGRRPRVA